MKNNTVDVALIGGGIMSATIGTLIAQLQPNWSITLLESRSEVATESSNAWNNAGTGHAAFCELNYMPEASDGSLNSAKAIEINEQFQVSRQWWASLVRENMLGDPSGFIHSVPHLTFVRGREQVGYLRRRFELLHQEPLFADMEFSEDAAQIAEWAPLVIEGRSTREMFAATRSRRGTDVDFGEITRRLITQLVAAGATLTLGQQATALRRRGDGTWDIDIRHQAGYAQSVLNARFVFVGAGGGALPLLQSSGIAEVRGYGGFPISGKFLRCQNPQVIQQHQAKVYGKAAVGAPPMSVPHLDTRIVNGTPSLLFGPYAGFTPKFLKKGSWWDLPGSIRPHNIGPMLRVGLSEFALEKYLLGEVFASRERQLATLREYLPSAQAQDWQMITAGQRVQMMKRHPKQGGTLQFGTEVVVGAEGTIAGLLGASPGASTAVSAMLKVLEQCFPEQFTHEWKPEILRRIPSYGIGLNHDARATAASLQASSEILGLPE